MNITLKIVLWVVGILFVLGIIGIMISDSEPIKTTDCDCSEIQTKLDTCVNLGLDMVDAWDEYQKALDDYCELDPYNNLCVIR